MKSVIVLLQDTRGQDVSEWWMRYKLANTNIHVRHHGLRFSGGVDRVVSQSRSTER